MIPAEDYLQFFASDRSHMHKSDGTWLARPPAYTCIVASGNAAAALVTLACLQGLFETACSRLVALTLVSLAICMYMNDAHGHV